MLSNTLSLGLLASFAALSLGAPLPLPGGDGVDIRFTEIQKINDNEFKKTSFNVHDKTEHDANFEQIEAQDKDLLEAVVFVKDGDRFIFHKRQVAIDADTDLDIDSALDDSEDLSIDDESFDNYLDTDLGADISFGFDLNQDIDVAFSDADLFPGVGSSFVKRGDDGEDIKFVEVKAIDEDRFKKTNFDVHDRTEHDKNFNQVEAENKDVFKVVDFRKDDDDDDYKHDRYHGGKFDDYY